MGLPSVLLSPNSKKKKSTWKNYYISGNGFSYFLKKKLFLFFTELNFFRFQGTETPKKFLIFWKMETPKILYISGNKNFLYFSIWNILIFQEMYNQNTHIFRTRSIFRTLVY